MKRVAPVPDRSRRWLIGFLLLAATPLMTWLAWLLTGVLADGDRTLQMFWSVVTLCLCVIVVCVWWLCFARLSWPGRVVVGLGAVGCLAVLAGTIRIETLSGEMLPVFAPRWRPTAEQQAVAYFASEPTSPATAPAEPAAVGDVNGDAAAPALPPIAPGDWPQFRGPQRDGVVRQGTVRTDWDAVPPVARWRHPVGPGWSGFAVVGERLYTQEQRGDQELVVCYDANNGRQLWTRAEATRFEETLGGVGPRATPTVTNDAVYSLGATGRLSCLDRGTGAVRWVRDILTDAGQPDAGEADAEQSPVANLQWGMAGSPLLFEGKVYVAPGGGRGRGVIAYDAGTGQIVWSAGTAPASYAAPTLALFDGQPHLLIFNGEGLHSHDPATGAVFFQVPWTNQPKVNAAVPIAVGDQLFLSSGYGVGSALLRVSRQGADWSTAEIWRANNEFKLKFNDAVLHDGFLYGIDEGILACYEFATGKRQWKRGRYGYGQLLLVGDTLLVLAEDGRLVALRATPQQFEELASFPALEGKTWNHPAFARGILYVRNDREAACYDLRPAAVAER